MNSNYDESENRLVRAVIWDDLGVNTDLLSA